MEADWSIEIGGEAAALELPWQDPAGKLHYFDLRATPEQLDQLPEVRDFPSLGAALRELNSSLSPWQTVKCDAWREDVEAEENPYGASFSQGSYVDVVLRPELSAGRYNLELHQQLARAAANWLDEQEEFEAEAEIVVRRCYFHPQGKMEESEDGVSLTLFLTGYGETAEAASQNWERALPLLTHSLLAAAESCVRAE